MTDKWIIGPPLTDHQLPPAHLGTSIRTDFSVNTIVSEDERLTCFEWTGLSRQEVANLRSLFKEEALLTLLRTYGYGLSKGATLDLSAKIDPNNAEFSLMIDSRESVPQSTIDEIVALIGRYRVS